MKTNSNKHLASTSNPTQVTSASNPNLQCASTSNSSGNNQLTLIQTQAPSMQSSSHHSSTSVTNVSTCSSPAQAKDALTMKQSMSVSMTSLPSPQHTAQGSTTFSTLLQQSTDMGGAAGNEFLSPNKVVIDKTYNSLKVIWS